MTVYVDDAYVDAGVPYRGRTLRSRWCHLTADTEEELHEFALRVGLRREWLQSAGRPGFHYDVTLPRRRRAVELGAVEITWREFGQLIVDRS